MAAVLMVVTGFVGTLLLLTLAFVQSPWTARLALATIWVATDLVDAAFGLWLWPVLGALLAPHTTVAFVVLVPGGMSAENWFVLGLGACVDAWRWRRRSTR